MIYHKREFLFLAVLSLSACSQETAAEKDRLKNDDAFAREVISELASAKDAELMRKFGALNTAPVGRIVFSKMRGQLPQGSPVVIKLDKTKQRIYNFQKMTDLIYFYSVDGDSARITVSLQHVNGKPRLLNLAVRSAKKQ
jgi:hypothetical protein